MMEGQDIILFSNDWGGDPLSKHQIALRLSKKNRILWVNSMGNRNPTVSAHDATVFEDSRSDSGSRVYRE